MTPLLTSLSTCVRALSDLADDPTTANRSAALRALRCVEDELRAVQPWPEAYAALASTVYARMPEKIHGIYSGSLTRLQVAALGSAVEMLRSEVEREEQTTEVRHAG